MVDQVAAAQGFGVGGMVEGAGAATVQGGQHGGDGVVPVAGIQPGAVARAQGQEAPAHPIEHPEPAGTVQARKPDDAGGQPLGGRRQHQPFRFRQHQGRDRGQHRHRGFLHLRAVPLAEDPGGAGEDEGPQGPAAGGGQQGLVGLQVGAPVGGFVAAPGRLQGQDGVQVEGDPLQGSGIGQVQGQRLNARRPGGFGAGGIAAHRGHPVAPGHQLGRHRLPQPSAPRHQHMHPGPHPSRLIFPWIPPAPR